MPTPYEDGAADTFVEGECPPHSDETPAEEKSEHPAEEYADKPLEQDADVEREIDIAYGAQYVGVEDVGDFTDLYEYVNDKDGATEGDNLRIVREQREDLSAHDGEDDADGERGADAKTEGVPPELVAGMIAMVANEVPDDYTRSLRYADAEDIDEYEGVDDVHTGGKCFVAKKVDEVGKHHLLRVVRHVLACRRQTDAQKVVSLMEEFPGRCAEGFDETSERYVAREEYAEKHEGCHASGYVCGYRCALNAHCRYAEVTEDEGIVADDIDHIHEHHDEHRVDGLVVGAE